MEVIINVDAVIRIAALLAALGTIGGAALWGVRFVERQKQQDKEIRAIREEQTLICFGILACLKGLREQGCNGPVTAALEKMEKHLNQAAHQGEAL